MARTISLFIGDDFVDIDDPPSGWSYDFVTGGVIAAPSVFQIPRHVSGTFPTDPLLVHSVSEYYDDFGTYYVFHGNIVVNRVGVSTFNGQTWDATFDENFDTSASTITRIAPLTPDAFLINFFTVDFGGSVAYPQIAGKTLGQLIGDGDTIVGTDWNDHLLTTNFSETVIGGFGADSLVTRGGNDTLVGGPGKDILVGGLGNDTYVLGAEATGVDIVSDIGGIDTITSTITRSLANYPTIDNLTLLGLAVFATGNNLVNVITGNAAANVLDGGKLGDIMRGAHWQRLLYRRQRPRHRRRNRRQRLRYRLVQRQFQPFSGRARHRCA